MSNDILLMKVSYFILEKNIFKIRLHNNYVLGISVDIVNEFLNL